MIVNQNGDDVFLSVGNDDWGMDFGYLSDLGGDGGAMEKVNDCGEIRNGNGG